MGMVTLYFTLMSFSFIIPVICAFYAAYTEDTGDHIGVSRSKTFIKYMILYIAGYCSFWAVKWVILAIADKGLLMEVADSIVKRLSHADYGEKVTLSEALLWNACGFYYKNTALTVSIGIFAAEAVLAVILCVLKKTFSVETDDILIVVLAAAATVGRYAAILNHSRVHYFFMNRLMSSFVYVLVSLGAIIIFRTLIKKEVSDE